MAEIYALNSVINSKVKRAYIDHSFRFKLRGMNIVLSSHFLSQYILVKQEK
jgi:hypothetical protein